MSASPVQPHEVAAAPSANVQSAPDRTTGARLWPAVGRRRPMVILGGCILLAGIVWFAFRPGTSSNRPVLNGRRLSGTELREAAQTLRSAGISNVRATRDQLLVAPESLAAANAALDKPLADTAPAQTPWTSAGSLLDQFSTGRRQQLASDAARAAQVGRLLEQLPGVAAAEVVWDEEPGISRRQPPRVRATVFLKLQPNALLELDTVHAVRTAVAGSRAHLSPADVTVMDLDRQLTYDLAGDPAAIAAESRLAEVIRYCRRRIAAALADIAGVQISIAHRSAPIADADQAGAPPVAHTTLHRPITGRAGPNLRLEVAASPPAEGPTHSPVQSIAAAPQSPPVSAAQLDVTIVAPPQYVSSWMRANAESRRLRRVRHDAAGSADHQQALLQAEIRRRVLVALADGPTSMIPVCVDVPLNLPLKPPLQAREAPTTNHRNWVGPALSEWARQIPQPAMIGMATAAGVLTGWVLIRPRRRARRTLLRAGAAGPSATSPEHSAVEAAPAFLPGVDVEQWAPLAAGEPVETVAGLLPRLSPNEVAHLIAQLAPSDQRNVLQLAPRSTLDDRAVEELRRRLLSGVQSPSRTAAIPASSAKPRPFRGAAHAANSTVPSVAGFDDLARVDDASLQTLAARVPAETWSAALVGASPKLVRRLGKLTTLAGRTSPLAERKPLRLHEIETAQRLIVEEWLSLQ